MFRKIGGKAVLDRETIAQIARDVVRDIGYDQEGFSYHGADVEVLLHGQSPDIAMGVDAKKKKSGEEEGAGDRMMFGFACTESEVYEKNSFMPAPIYFAHKILKVLSDKRRSGQLFDLQPDAKSQVTVQYVDGKPDGSPRSCSTQHNEKNRNAKKYRRHGQGHDRRRGGIRFAERLDAEAAIGLFGEPDGEFRRRRA